jgi:hypothetical protein
MASISHCRTLGARKVLLRHQMLHAMHLTFGRPALRPQPPEVLGTGVHWAFDGESAHGVLRGPDGAVVDPATIEGMPEFLRRANQLTEMMLLAGPGDEEIGELREHYGYRPEAVDVVGASRLEWEASYVENSPSIQPARRSCACLRPAARRSGMTAGIGGAPPMGMRAG